MGAAPLAGTVPRAGGFAPLAGLAGGAGVLVFDAEAAVGLESLSRAAFALDMDVFRVGVGTGGFAALALARDAAVGA